jgi:hypothetical protein
MNPFLSDSSCRLSSRRSAGPSPEVFSTQYSPGGAAAAAACWVTAIERDGTGERYAVWDFRFIDKRRPDSAPSRKWRVISVW